MATDLRGFKRLVLGLQPNSPDRAMRLAVELANLLRLDLLGVLLDDTSLHCLAGIPIAREFRRLGGGWQPIDLDQLSNELDVAARKNERMFAEAAKGLSTSCRFEVIKGPTATTIEQIARSGDIVVIAEPASSAERATQQFTWLIDAAFRSASAVMVVPPQVARREGPIVAIAGAPDDRGISTAAMIAAAVNEELVIVQASGAAAHEPSSRDIAGETGIGIRRMTGDLPLSDPAFASHALRDLRERLVVVTRSAVSTESAMLIGSSRRVPVLVID